MGAWIEIGNIYDIHDIHDVAPLVGAWIEIECIIALDWTALVSLPLWERGLKFKLAYTEQVNFWQSLPLWERGLKFLRLTAVAGI